MSDEPTDEQLTDLLNRLVEATDQPEAGEYLTFPSAAGPVIQVSPVADVDEFVQRLTFVTIQSADSEQRRIGIELKPAQ